MHILVLGAGILGTTSAWFLRAAGHDVTVVERASGPALETSFANGSQISVSYAEPWANPHAPLQVLRWLGQEDAPLLFRLRADPQQWRWGLNFLLQCLPANTRFNTRQLVNLGLYSRATLIALRRELGLEYRHLEKGILHLYRSPADLEQATPGMRLMRDLGMDIRFLATHELATVEPSLAGRAGLFAGGVYAPQDETGDAFLFTNQLAQRAAQRGVAFRFDTTVLGLRRDGDRLRGVQIRDAGGECTLTADAYVVALGSWSAPLLRAVGVSTLVYPVKGYSATFPVLKPAAVTTTSLTDHSMKIVFSRLGDELRIAGTAELTGYNLDLNPARCAPLARRAAELFPEALDFSAVRYWTGLRPATPSNLPYIGRSSLFGNLWLNTGHGTLGWTHGAGSGRALADLISGRRPEVAFRFLG